MLRQRCLNRIFICYDIFLDGCEKEVRDKIDQCVDQPIHVIYEVEDVYHLRNPALDRPIALEYASLQQMDRGSRPYFTDSKNPPVYDEGRRVDNPEEELYESSSAEEEEGQGES